MMVGSNGRARGTLLLVLLVVSDSFAPPPLERACPGPLDAGNDALCLAPGVVQMAADSVVVRLDTGNVVIRVTRLGGFFGMATVKYVTVNDSALAGMQYVQSSGELLWRSTEGQTKSISVPLLNTGSYVPGTYRTRFSVRLTGISGVELGVLKEAGVTIINTNARTGSISLPSDNIVVSESAGTIKLNVTRTGGSDCDATVSYRTVAYPGDGSGQYGADKPSQQGSITWVEGDSTTKFISLPVIEDEIPRFSGVRFYVQLYGNTCAAIGVEKVLVTAVDNDFVGFLSVPPKMKVFSNDNYVQIPVSRVGGSAEPISLTYFTSAGPGAVAGKHFVPVSGQLIWMHDDIRTQYVEVSIPQGRWWSGEQYSISFLFRVAFVTGTSMLDNILATTVEIVDILASPGRIDFMVSTPCRGDNESPSGNCYYAREVDREAQLVVLRTGGQVGQVTVRYVATNFRASSATATLKISGILTWMEGDSSPKIIRIPIQNGTIGRPLMEYIQVALVDVTIDNGNAPVLDSNTAIAYVAIISSSGFSFLELSWQKATFWEDEGFANFTVNRVGGDFGSVSCRIKTEQRQALAGMDFISVSELLKWSDGDTSSKRLSVPLINDVKYRFGTFLKNFVVTISEGSNGTFIDPRFESVDFVIADDDVTPGYASFPDIDYDPFTQNLFGSHTIKSLVSDEVVTLRVVRKGGIQGNLIVHYRTMNITAKPGQDFKPLSGVLKWLEGDVSDKFISVEILEPPALLEESVTGLAHVELNTDFIVILENQGLYSGTYEQPLGVSIPQISARIVVEPQLGKGFFKFEQLEYNVNESDGQVRLGVERVGGRVGSATVTYSTVGDLDATLLAGSAAFPWSCAGLPTSGVRSVQTTDGVREIYCDMSGGPSRGSASMFHWDRSTVLYDRKCIANAGTGDMDNHILWADLTARIGNGTDESTSTTPSFSSWQAFPQFKVDTGLDFDRELRPSSMGSKARPVPFPMNKRVAWFDGENRLIYWKNNSKTLKISFDEVGISGDGGMNHSSSNFYFISDGINTVHVGNPNSTCANENNESSTCNATLLSFDWSSDTVQSGQALPMTLSLSEWCTPDYDAFGHVLWTVNGRVMYKTCNYDGLQVVLGGTIDNPMAQSDKFNFSKCPDNIPGCQDWSITRKNLKGGVDLFAHVDPSGFLYFGDRGQSGGIFGCSDALKPFGVVRTNIELGRRVQSDFVSSSGSLQWDDGDAVTKYFTINIVKDGTRDDRLLEKFAVRIVDSKPTRIIRKFQRAVVTIYDSDGSGVVSIAPDYKIVSERGQCCDNCLAPERYRKWCSYFNLYRSFGRGPVCVDYLLRGVADANLSLVFSVENDAILSAYTGIHVSDQNGTICWGHNDTKPRNLAVYFPLHMSFDLLHKRFAIEVNGTTDQSLISALPSGPTAPIVTARATQIIEDADASTGFLTLNADPISTFSTFTYSTDSGSAQLTVERIGGSELDIDVDFSTELLLPSQIGIEIPVTVQVVDGSNGTNTFCQAKSLQSVGACVDSTSAFFCKDGFCWLRDTRTSKQANGTTMYVSPPGDAQFIRTTGKLRWRQGETGKKPITIPILSQRDVSSFLSFPAFRVVISNVTSSQAGLEASFNFPSLPNRNAFGNCNFTMCHDKADGLPIGFCDTDSCRRMETSEAIIVLEPENGPGTLRLLNSSYFIREDIHFFVFPVKRVFGHQGDISVNYTCASYEIKNVSVAALEGQEFVPVQGILQWAHEDLSDKFIRVPIIDDTKYIKGRSKRSFRVTIHGVAGGALIDSKWSNATIIIVDDDASPGAVVFRYSRKSFLESQTSGMIEIARVGGDDLDIYVEFNTGKQSSWASVLDQTGNASAHSSLLMTEIYSCSTTLDRIVSASSETTRRGGGGAALAFDFDTTTFWDGEHISNDDPKSLQIHLSKCRLQGANVNAYGFVTGNNSGQSGCPSDWTFEGSTDGIEWTVLDKRLNQICTPNGQVYGITPGKVNPYLYYRWTISRDKEGLTAFKIYEARLFFIGQGNNSLASNSIIQPRLCDSQGKCCIFKAGECDPSGGFIDRLLIQSSYDYEYVRRILSWKEGENSTKSVSIPILNDCMGCSNSRCTSPSSSEYGPLQDLPYEEFPLHLGLVSDVEIAKVSGSAAALFPFRLDPEIAPLNSAAIISIVDDDGPGILSVWSTSCGVKSGLEVKSFETIFGKERGYDASCAILETARTIEFMVTRTQSARGLVSVQYSVEGVTAIPNTDFIPTNGTLTWSHDDSSPKVFEVQVLRTPGYVPGFYTRTIKAKLVGNDMMHLAGWSTGYKAVEGGAQLRNCEASVTGICIDPSKSEFVVTIIDADARPGTVKLLLADRPPELQYYVDQSNGTVSIYVERVNGSDFEITANFTTVQISADEARPCISGNRFDCEYVDTSGKVNWKELEIGVKPFSIQLGTSAMRSPFERFKVRVWGRLNDNLDLCGGYGSIDISRGFEPSLCDRFFDSEITVTIRRSAATGYIGLVSQAPWPYTVSDNIPSAIVAVDRLMGKFGVVVVDYTVEGYPDGGNAIAGIHFNAVSGQLTWLDRDNAPKFIQIEIKQGSVPMNTAVDFTVRLRFHSSNTNIYLPQQTARVVIRSSSFQFLWKRKLITGSSKVFGELNVISVQFQPNMVIGPGTEIMISGITGTKTINDAAFAITGQAAHIFGNRAYWNQSSGSVRLIVSPEHSIPFATESTFSFVVRNGQTNQSVNPGIVVQGSVMCTRTQADGVPLSCPESVNIPSTSMDGLALQTDTNTFSPAKAESRMCPYASCPHSYFFGALNYVTTSFISPKQLGSGTKFSLSGLGSSQILDANTSVTFVNVSTDVGVGEYKNETRKCSCTFPRCTCEQTFSYIPKDTAVKLRVKLQCNALGFGRQYGDTISVQVGERTFSDLDSVLSAPNSSCLNQCSKLHDLFNPPEKDVSDHVSNIGQLFVSISSSSYNDFCGNGEYLNALLTVQWQRVSRTVLNVPAEWKGRSGSLMFHVPQDYRIDAGQMVSFTFALRNPSVANPGSTMQLLAESGESGGSTSNDVGPTTVIGLILTSHTSTNLEWSAIPESNSWKGKSNRIGIGLKFNGPTGGTEDGIFVNVTGLFATGMDNPRIMIRLCSFCSFPFQEYGDLSKLVGDPRQGRQGRGAWISSEGLLQLWIRGPGPSYLVPDLALSGMIVLLNTDNPAPSTVGIVIKASAPVLGADIPSARTLTAALGGPLQVLRAPLTTSVIAGSTVEFARSSAYLEQEAITLKIDFRYNLQNLDNVSIILPSLTTCEIFIGRKGQTCVQSFIGTATPANSSLVSGVPDDAVIFYWNESMSTLSLSPQGGRAICRNRTFGITIKASDYGCSDFGCKLKLLPDLVSQKMGIASLTSDALLMNCLEKDCGAYCTRGDECGAGLKCKNQNDFHELADEEVCGGDLDCICSEGTGDFTVSPSCSNFDKIALPLCSTTVPVVSGKVEALPAAAWGRMSANFDSKGRAWFSARAHNDRIFVLGGITSDGFAGSSLVSEDGINWSNVCSPPFSPRAFFPSVYHKGYMWVLGGRAQNLNSSKNDVWKSEDGESWCLVSATSRWSARYDHAAVSYSDKIWIIGGASSNGTVLDDVWSSYDGRTWTSPGRASGSRRGHALVVYLGKMWIYGGFGNGSVVYRDVWNSVDGATWVRVTVAASWASRGYHSSFAFDNELWLVGGNNNSAAFSDIWTSSDGATWQLENADAHWGKRYGSEVIVFLGRMWIMGGSALQCNSNGVSRCQTTEQTLKCQGALASCSSNEVWMDAFKPINVDFVEITPSSSVLGADNLIQVSVKFDARLDVGASLEISGLNGVVSDSEIAVSGRNASVVGWKGKFDAATASAKFVQQKSLPAGSLLKISFLVQNSATVQSRSALHLVARHNLENFTNCRNASWSSMTSGTIGFERTRLNTNTIMTTTPYNGGVMFDIDVKNSIMLDSFIIQVPPNFQSPPNITNDTFVKVYYKEGSYSSAMSNLSNWCLLGSANFAYRNIPVSNLTIPVSNLQHTQFEWLGSQSTWILNSSSYMSSAFDGIVNFSVGSNGLWHSGCQGNCAAKCIHFPLCSQSWPFDKKQWLSFDLGAKFVLSGFRTTFPPFDRAPLYIFDGVPSTFMNSEKWEQAQFKEFEIQYSSGALNGPWTVAFSGVAEKQATGFQTFMFEPRTARYWRFLMRNNYGFAYIAVQSIEFYGASSYCQTIYDSLHVETDQNGTILAKGVGISSGLHAFLLQTGVGVNFKTGVRRGNILMSDNSASVKVGSHFRIYPKIAWEGVSSQTNIRSINIQPQESQFLNSDGGFSMVVRFVVGDAGQDGHIVGMGTACNGGLSLRITGRTVKFHQGCSGGAIDRAIDAGFNLIQNRTYCYAVTYRKGTFTAYAENLQNSSHAYLKNESVVLENVPNFSTISVGADFQRSQAFTGSVSGIGIYEGVMDQTQMMVACRERCSARQDTGRCYTPAPLPNSPDQEFPSAKQGAWGATDIDFIRLPTRPCFQEYRLRVVASGTTKWCIQELSFFHTEPSEMHSEASYLSTLKFPNGSNIAVEHGRCTGSLQTGCSATDTDLLQRTYAFDGRNDDGGREYCNTFSSGGSSSYISLRFPSTTSSLSQLYAGPQCITGYRIQANVINSTQGPPTAWYLEGSNPTSGQSGKRWTTIDNQFGITWTELEWKTFNVDMRPFLLITNPYLRTYLLRWISDEEGWDTHQNLSSSGADQANVFQDSDDYYSEFLFPNMTRSSLLKWDPFLTNFVSWDGTATPPPNVTAQTDSTECSGVATAPSGCPARVVMLGGNTRFVPFTVSKGDTTAVITQLYDLGLSTDTCSYNRADVADPMMPDVADPMMQKNAAESFTIDGVKHVIVSQYNRSFQTCSFLFKYGNSSTDSVELEQTFHTNGAVNWAHFVMAGANYLAVANFYDGALGTHTTMSTIYKWDGLMFTEWQSILTHRARSWKPFEVDGENYLFLSSAAQTSSATFASSNSSSTNLQSVIYRFNGAAFEYSANVPSDGAVAAELFKVNGYTYLAVANMEKLSAGITPSSNVKTRLYKWGNATNAEIIGGLRFTDAYSVSAMFVERSISDTTNVTDELNVVTVKFRANRPLSAGTVITIYGLVGSQTLSNTLVLRGEHAGVFSSIAEWDGKIGRLKLVVQTDITVQQMTSVSFELQNGLQLQNSTIPAIEASGIVRIRRMSMKGKVLGILSRPAPGLQNVIATESSRVQGSLFNKITLTFRPTVDIPSGMLINITELKARDTEGVVEITGSGMNSIASSMTLYKASGIWSPSTGSLRFALTGNGIPVFTNFSFSFILSNQLDQQTPVFPIVRAQFQNGSDFLPSASSSTSILSSSERPAFKVAELSDSNKVLGASNNITVRLRPNVGLMGGTRFTITGLEESVTGRTLGGGNVIMWSSTRLFVESRGVLDPVSKGSMVFRTLPVCKALCPGGSCLEHGRDCRFPFSYQGTVYYDCLKLDGLRLPVCSTIRNFDEAQNISAGSTGMMGWANTSGWGYCPSICGPTFPEDVVTEFRFQFTNSPTPRLASVQNIFFADTKNAIQISQQMTTKNGILNPREGAKSLLLGARSSVSTYGNLAYSLSEFTAEAWIKPVGTSQTRHSLIQVGNFSLTFAISSGVNLSLPPLTTNGSIRNFLFPGWNGASNVTSWHHVSVSWSNDTGNLNLYYNGVLNATIQNINGVLRLNAPLTLGSSQSTVSMGLTQVRLWSSASANAYFDEMIDPASVEIGDGAKLIAYYPFSTASTFTGISENTAFTNAGTDRSTQNNDLNLGSAQIDTIPMTELFLDVIQFG